MGYVSQELRFFSLFFFPFCLFLMGVGFETVGVWMGFGTVEVWVGFETVEVWVGFETVWVGFVCGVGICMCM